MTDQQQPETSESFSVVILAGGFGRRLGRDKATCPAAGRPLLHWTALAAAEVSDDLIVVRRPDQQFLTAMGAPWREVADRRPDRGPLAGLEAALVAAAHDLTLMVACDMPLLRPDLLRLVAQQADAVDIAMPQVDGFAQPLLAAYRRSLAPLVAQLLDEGEGRLRALLPLASHRLIDADTLRAADPQLESLTNVNQPDDLARVEHVLQQRTTPAQP